MKSVFASALIFFAPALAVAQEVTIGDDCEPVGPIKGSGSCKDDYASCVEACAADCHTCAGSNCTVCIGCRPPCKSPCPTSSTCAFACTDCADCRDKANACAKACAPEYLRCKEAFDAQASAATHRWVPAEQKGKKAAELRLMRNEVFARHGYLFTGDLLFFHFKKERWYTGSRKNVDKLLTDIDRANVEVLKQAEKTAADAELAALPEEFRAVWFEFRAAAATRDTARLGGLTCSHSSRTWASRRSWPERASTRRSTNCCSPPPSR